MSPSRHCGDVGSNVTGGNFPYGEHTQFWLFCARGCVWDGQSLSGDTRVAEHRGNRWHLAATKTCHVPLSKGSLR